MSGGAEPGVAVDMATRIGELVLTSPVMVASGCGASGRELEPFLDLTALGAFVTRSVTLDARAGGAPPRAVETAGGLLVDTGLQGPGVQGFLAAELPWLAQRRTRTVVSIAGETLGEFAELARRVGEAPGVAAVEVNLGWPDDAPAARDSFRAAKIVAAVRRDQPRGVPVLVKLAPVATAVADVARAVVKAGADGVVVGHGVPGMALDPVSLRPAPAAGGMLGGPAVHAVTLRCVWEVHAALPDVPVIASGGVGSGRDALLMIAAGASAVQVGSIMLHDPAAPERVTAELCAELAARGAATVRELVGRAHRPEGAP